MVRRSAHGCAPLIPSYASRSQPMRGSTSRLSYGFVAGPGVYETTVTRPDLFRAYLTEQIRLLIKNHDVPVEIGEFNEPIPIHFAFRRDINIEVTPGDKGGSRVHRPLRDVFDTPDLPPWTTRSPTAR